MNIEKIKEDIKKTGLIIEERRRDLSMSSVQLAEMCCLSPEYIAEVECGVRVPSYTALKRISKVLQTPPDIILLGVRLHPPHYADKKLGQM